EGILPHAPEQQFHAASLDIDPIKSLLKDDPTAAKIFTEVIVSYVTWGRPYTSHLPELDPARSIFASMIYSYFLEFVVAHEYGHIFNNHLTDQNKLRVPQGANTAEATMWNWKQECEADVAACGLMFARSLTKPLNLAAALMGIEVFLSCYE